MDDENEIFYYDESIEIDIDVLPKVLQNTIREIEGYRKNNDWVMYDGVSEGIESLSKQALMDHLITEKQFRLLLQKYRGIIG